MFLVSDCQNYLAVYSFYTGLSLVHLYSVFGTDCQYQ